MRSLESFQLSSFGTTNVSSKGKRAHNSSNVELSSCVLQERDSKVRLLGLGRCSFYRKPCRVLAKCPCPYTPGYFSFYCFLVNAKIIAALEWRKQAVFPVKAMFRLVWITEFWIQSEDFLEPLPLRGVNRWGSRCCLALGSMNTSRLIRKPRISDDHKSSGSACRLHANFLERGKRKNLLIRLSVCYDTDGRPRFHFS